jgi:hypothetical protein
MTTKLTKSKIQVSGKIEISYTGIRKDSILGNVGIGKEIEIKLEGLKQSKSGVYEILNKFNGKRYIGMARNLDSRKKHHWWDLNNKCHKSKEMQEDFDLWNCTELVPDINPEQLFEFNVVVYCYPSELTFWEKILIDNLHPEYNTKKKKELPPKVFDINGSRLEQELIEEDKKYLKDFDLDDCEQEIM